MKTRENINSAAKNGFGVSFPEIFKEFFLNRQQIFTFAVYTIVAVKE